MALDLPTVIKQLTDSGIIAPGKLENFIPPKADPKTPEELVQALVKSENLTAFQGQQVKGGRAKSLILGEYTILDKIGAGGMGQVFKAIHRRLKRVVAIKMLPPAVTKDAAAVARFQREVEAAAKLRHPNVVATDDAGYANGVHFLVMEYVDGKDLSAMVKKDGPFPVPKAVNYILQAARGLEFAHSEGVVHRDIKPANLLLDKKEVVKILDMGLARIEQADGGVQSELTGTGTIMGTVDYMSPEQALNTKDADQRADIYSLGMSLYYLLAGKAAYSGDTAMQKLMAHQNQPIPSLQEVQTTVSKQLEAVFKKMVAKRIEDRYQTMSEVVEALEGLGFGGSSTGRKGDVASTLDLSSADRKKLLSQAKKQPLSSITEVVASENSKNLILKIVGGSFGTIVAPILVFYLIRHLEKPEQPVNPPAAIAPAATVPPVVVATNTSPQPPAHVENDGSPKLLVAPFDAKQAHAGQAAWAKHLGTQVEQKNFVGMTMVLIPPGEFLMGSTPEQIAVGRTMGEDDEIAPTDTYFGRLAEEMPQHKVTISQPFLMGSTEVTVAQFRKFVEASKYVTDAEKAKDKEEDKARNWKNLGYPTSDDTAVTQISWNDAVAYCAWLSEQEQRRPWYRVDGKGRWVIAAHADGFRLPTEAEWEYACRAGTTTQYSFGDDKTQSERYGWFSKNAGYKPQPVALKLPNPFGLFDMHGNAYEWCQDHYDGKWYEKSSPTDPNGPSSGHLVIRGGSCYYNASMSRSASRSLDGPTNRAFNYGFRIVRSLNATQPETAVATTAKPSASPTKPTKPWETPAFQAWVKATQAMPAEKQIEAVSKKLMELNAGFDGKVAPKIEKGVVTEFTFHSDNVTDISPVRALARLRVLYCIGLGSKGAVADLSPLNGLLLNTLVFYGNPVCDLSPLTGMRLVSLNCSDTSVSDLSPLKGMPLFNLDCYITQVADLSPLEGCKNLETLKVTRSKVTAAQVAALQKALPKCKIEWDDLAKAVAGQPNQLWNTQAFQAWVNATQALPAETQVEAISKKLMELNPGFDGKMTGWDRVATPKVEKGVVTEIGFSTDNTTDISPVRALAGLKNLNCDGSSNGKGKLSDLSPLEGMELATLYCNNTQVSTLSPLKGMPLVTLYVNNTQVFDLSPLQGMPLTTLTFGNTQVSTLSPLKGMPLVTLYVNNTQVSDLSPLRGTSLTTLYCNTTKVADLSTVQDCKSLKTLDVRSTNVTAASVAALQKALPNCKVDWDGAAKLAYLNPAFQQWVKATQALPAEQQIEAVSKKLMELNPGFDGKVMGADGKGTPKIETGLVTEFGFLADNVTDISPVRALVGLKYLACGASGPGKSKLSDFSPLHGMTLTILFCNDTQLSDLSPLEGMPLKYLICANTTISDLSPLRELPLTNLACNGCKLLSDLSPLQGNPLIDLQLAHTQVSDLSPLQSTPVTNLNCYSTPVSDLSPLQDCKRLTNLKITSTKVTPSAVAALQNALPNCKIEWDDPAKPKTPDPAASSTK